MGTSAGKIVWTGRVISFLVSLPFLMSGAMKLKGGPELDQGFAHLELPASIRVPLAILELSCVVVYLIPRLSVLGAVLLTGYMGGTIITHWRVGDPFIAQIIIGLVIWLGVYLRDSRLKSLLPLRTQLKEG